MNIIEIIIVRKLPCCRCRKYCLPQSSHILTLPNPFPNYFLCAIQCHFDNLSPWLRGPGRLCIRRKCPSRSTEGCSPKRRLKGGRRRVSRLWRCSCLIRWEWKMRAWMALRRFCRGRRMMCFRRCKDRLIQELLRSFGYRWTLLRESLLDSQRLARLRNNQQPVGLTSARRIQTFWCCLGQRLCRLHWRRNMRHKCLETSPFRCSRSNQYPRFFCPHSCQHFRPVISFDWTLNPNPKNYHCNSPNSHLIPCDWPLLSPIFPLLLWSC